MNSIEYLNNKKFKIYYPENVQEAVINAIKSGRIWEKKLLNNYKDLILPGNTVLDIGAYLGTHYNTIKKIQFSNTNNGKASITHIRPRLPNPVKKEIQTITIDSLNLDRCDFMKIDVEMCEWVVLEGSEETITKYRPIIFVEIFKTPNNLLKLITFTKQHNYSYASMGGADFVLLPN